MLIIREGNLWVLMLLVAGQTNSILTMSVIVMSVQVTLKAIMKLALTRNVSI